MAMSLPIPAGSLVRRQPKAGPSIQIVFEPNRFALPVTWGETSAQSIPVIRPQSGKLVPTLRHRQISMTRYLGRMK